MIKKCNETTEIERLKEYLVVLSWQLEDLQFEINEVNDKINELEESF